MGVAALVALLAACGAGAGDAIDEAAPTEPSPTAPTSSPATTPPGTGPTSPPAAETDAPPSAPSSPSGSPTALPPFESTVEPVTVERLGVTWRPGCPVEPTDLRLVTVTYATFDGGAATGELVLNEQVVDDVVAAFAELYEARFPIHKMVTMEVYGGVDGAAGKDNNSSGFNCRNVRGTDRWSQHAYGLAIDINPRQNPYLVGGEIRPPDGAAYLDRSDVRPGMIVESDAVFDAFTSRGFEWGGFFVTTPDYQHFALPR